jgi:uncharacterized membrane protein
MKTTQEDSAMDIALPLLDTDGWHHGWFLWPLIPLFWLTVIVLFARFCWWRGPGRRGPDPRRILAERYASGDISHDEYRERLANLQS